MKCCATHTSSSLGNELYHLLRRIDAAGDHHQQLLRHCRHLGNTNTNVAAHTQRKARIEGLQAPLQCIAWRKVLYSNIQDSTNAQECCNKRRRALCWPLLLTTRAHSVWHTHWRAKVDQPAHEQIAEKLDGPQMLLVLLHAEQARCQWSPCC